jgi:hypothetical protein
VSELLKRVLQMFFQQKAGVIGADSDAHDARLYYGSAECLKPEV